MTLTDYLTIAALGAFIAGAIGYKRTERWIYVACFAIIGLILPIVGIVLAAVWKVPKLTNGA